MSNFNTVLPIAPGLDDYTVNTCRVEQLIQLQANQIIELKEEIAERKRSQRETDETIIGMNSEMEKMNRWAVVTVEELDELRNIIENEEIYDLKREMKAKSVEYTSMSRVFTRDLAELCHIRNRIVPKMERLIHWMSTQPDAKRFLEENDLDRPLHF